MGVSVSPIEEMPKGEEIKPPSRMNEPAPLPAVSEPDLPVTVIEPRSGWRLVDLGELWRFRELLFFLGWRDIKVRYKQTVLGAAWAVLKPLATMAAFALFLGSVASSATASTPYPLFVLAGLLPWTLFSAVVTGASTSVVTNQNLVTKIFFPRLLVPLSSTASSLLDFLIAFAVLLVLAPFSSIWPGWGMLALPVVLLTLLFLAIGLGVLLAALTVAYRDFQVVVPLALQLWMFATPALFLQDLNVLGPRMQAALPLNPLHGLIVNFRAATLGTPFDLASLGISGLWALVLLVGGCFYFRRVERGFADII